jgi:superoxide dismutase
MKGIYVYIDLETGEIVYVGKDSHIDKNTRHYSHSSSSKYDAQPFNKILQNNPDRYEYSVIWTAEDCTTLKLNKMEILFGKIYNPKFNFDKFGKGGCEGHTDKTKKKISQNNARYWEGKKRSDEARQKMSKSASKRNTSGYYRVGKKKDKRYKQGFTWQYRYPDENGKRQSIYSTDIKKLESKVKARGLTWKKINEVV